MKRMIELIITAEDNLKIVVNNRREFAIEYPELSMKDERCSLSDLLDDSGYIGNDWYSPIDIGLTEAPAISSGALYNDDESEAPDDYEKLWYYADYNVTSYLVKLLKEGQVIFTKHS